MDFKVTRVSNYLETSVDGNEEHLFNKKESIELVQKMLEAVSNILYYSNIQAESRIASSLSDILNNYK